MKQRHNPRSGFVQPVVPSDGLPPPLNADVWRQRCSQRLFSMSKDYKFIRRGPLEGKKITFALTEQIESFAYLTNEFMEKIFDLEPGEYLITDESDLRDFTDMGSGDTSTIWASIIEHYGIDLSDVGSERLVKIMSEIGRRRNLQ